MPGHSHHTNLLRGPLDGGISIQGTNFLNNLHINSHHILLNILNTLISSRSYSYRTILPLMHQYDFSCLLNLILTQTIK